MLDTHGAGAKIVSQEWWIYLAAGTAVALLITVLLGAVLLRQLLKLRNLSPEPHDTRGVRWILVGGIAMPLVVLVILFGITITDLWALSAPPTKEAVTISVMGYRWWWKVEYPEIGVTTANQITIPVGQAVRIDLTSNDVIHSFWVPQLHFKRDAFPGKFNSIWLQADEPGIYRGECAEFCGQQHAQMNLMVVALTPERYQEWIAGAQQPAHEPETDLAKAGKEVFLSNTCIFCHTIKGAPATGHVGPDLTHLASRQTIAAGALENNTGNLAGWIMDPQHIKPGSLMPPAQLKGQELQALLAYLNQLK